MRDVFSAVLSHLKNGNDCVVAVIGGCSGSAPRKEGTVMAVFENENAVGTLGGGSMEFHAIEFARELLKSKSCAFHKSFNLHEQAPATVGMICGGDVVVHFYYISAEESGWITIFEECLNHMNNAKQGIVCMYDDGHWSIVSDLTSPLLKEILVSIPLEIGQRAILFGAGHVSMALSPVLAKIGFRVTVFDDRKELLTAERFPHAEKLIFGDFSSLDRFIEFRHDDFAVVLTASHQYDYTVETKILPLRLAYIGVIGSKRKVALTAKRLEDDGFSKELIESIHTPIGLAIKAVTPAEIAISIAAEMILERANYLEALGLMPKAGCPMHE